MTVTTRNSESRWRNRYMLLLIVLACAGAGAYLIFGGGGRARGDIAAKADSPDYILPHCRLHDTYEGILITGGIGAGKTSGPGSMAARRLLAHPSRPGFLVLTARPTEVHRWRKYCEQEGRAADFVRVAPGTHCFDALGFALSHPHATIEDAASILDVLLEVIMRSNPGGGGEDVFWRAYGQRLLRNSIGLVWKSTGTCSLLHIYNVFVGAPNSVEDLKNPRWHATSFLAECVRKGDERCKDDPDYQAYRNMWLSEWPQTGERQRATGQAIVTNLLAKFLGTAQIRDMVSSGRTTISPHDIIDDGKVVVIDMPTLTWGVTGRFVQIIFKTLTQKAVLARNINTHPRPVVAWMDEGQVFAVADLDTNVQAVAREAKLINCVLTQTLPGVKVALGSGPGAENQAMAWLGNFSIKVMCANSCVHTNRFCSDVLGNAWMDVESGNMPGEPQYDPGTELDGRPLQGGPTMSWRAEYRPEVPPESFTRLIKGGSGLVEAYLFQNGRVFPNGKTWTKILFQQS